jgi:predicted TIM-barrel fold metal-dependent hydrolase
MRKEYELSDEQLNKLLEASRPVRYMVVGGLEPSSPRENANAEWKRLGEEMGFEYLTVKPVNGKGRKFFTAETKAGLEE